MRLAEHEDVENILCYLQKDLGSCVYLYMDIKKYGLSNEHMKVWVNEGSRITTVVMKYYDSIQLYAAEKECDILGIVRCIQEENVRMISGRKTLIDVIREYGFIAEEYSSKDGSVFLFKNYREFQTDGIEMAKPEDMREIANLICMDAEFAGNYDKDILEEQLRERLITGMGRSCIIRKDKRIIAHIATFAEAANIAVTSGLIVHPQYRDYPYGTIMESYLVNVLKKEGFKIFTFVNDQKRVRLLRALGNQECGRYEKLKKKGVDMNIHHIGQLTKNIGGWGIKEFENLGFVQESAVFEDGNRKIKVLFMTNGNYRIELIEPQGPESPFYSLLKKYKNTPYHICYEVKQMEEKIEGLRKEGYMLLQAPLQAPAIYNRRAAFMLHPAVGIIELLESEDRS